MRQGKVKAALQLLEDHRKGGVLSFDDTIQINAKQNTVREVLMENTPPGIPQRPTPIPDIHVLFDNLDGEIFTKSSPLN